MELQSLSVPEKESSQVQEGCLYILSDIFSMSLWTLYILSSELCWNYLGPTSNGSKLTLLVVITTSSLYISYALGHGSPSLKLTDMSVLNLIHPWGTVVHKSWLLSPQVCSARNQILFPPTPHQDRAHLIGSVIINKELLVNFNFLES